jgi:hypothetical protein
LRFIDLARGFAGDDAGEVRAGTTATDETRAVDARAKKCAPIVRYA